MFTYVVVYETPRFGVHHFLLCFGSSSEQVKNPLMKPKWVNELHQKQSLLDLDAVILAINSSNAAKIFFDRNVRPKRSSVQLPIVCMFSALIWNLLAISVASFSTLFYIILQLLSRFASYGSESWICIILAKAFCNTWKNIRIRCCQILYWPIFLGGDYHRSLSCVEYAEKAALHRHAMWSCIVVDLFLGSLIGLALLFHAESACLCVLKFAHDITNNLLRSGCVWLMGVPAGFKLNTELAGILGMISFNAIQIWSTLWFHMGFLFIYFIKGLAISGVILGVTIPAALMIDMIALATLHVSSVNWFLSLLYSLQIQALAALWRLFGGRKWNPLRRRLDSYDYTVEQHIVGSLLFTPLLLLLPTTSVFYIFFTILNTTICLLCILVEITISIIHATPYSKIFLWLMSPRRFPSGTWLEIISSQSNAIDSPEIGCLNEIGSPSTGTQQRKDSSERRSSVLVSFLRSNLLNIGQILLPHYKNMFSGVRGSFITSSARGLLTGRRMPSTLGTGLPAPMPWMSIPYKEYWRLCRDSVIACMQNPEHHLIQ